MSRGRIPLLLTPIVGLLAVVGAAGASHDRLAHADSGTLTFEVELLVRYRPADCPTGTPNNVSCFARTGTGPIRGLGNVSESYPYAEAEITPGCPAGELRVLPATVRLSVEGKGELELRLGGSDCLAHVPPRRGEQTFTITNGSGRFAEASGGGTITHESYGPPSFGGRDKWSGKLVVPGLDFDLTAPIVTGARNRTVRAAPGRKRVRVTYNVVAQDEVDGAVAVVCRPRSGAWFSVGRTRVRCSATDSSANESTATFVVTVKRAG